MEFDTTATLLGSAWQDEEGGMFFLVGTVNSVVLISEGEIIWENQIYEPTALKMIDFGIGDGPEIIITQCSLVNGIVNVLSGENFEEHSRTEILETEFIRQMWPWHTIYHGEITSIECFEDAFPDESKQFLIGNVDFEEENGYIDNHWHNRTGRILVTSADNDQPGTCFRGGAIITTEIIDANGDDLQDLIIGHHEYHRFYEMRLYGDDIDEGSSTIMISVLNQRFNRIGNATLIDYEWNNSNDRRNLGTLGNLSRIKAVTTDQNLAQLYVTLQDSSGYRLIRMNLPNLAITGFRQMPQSVVKGLEAYSNDFLIAILADGSLIQIDLESFDIVNIFNDFASNPVNAEIGNFDDDEDLEMVVLTSEAFIMYDLGQLAAPSTSEPPWIPERCEIVIAYPNPFNSLTRVEYSVFQPGMVALTLHDLTGREIIRLADGWRSAGNYNLILDACDLTSGIYLLRLDADGQRSAKKIQLLK